MGGVTKYANKWDGVRMNQIPNIPDSKRLNEFQRLNLEEQITLLRQSLELFPRVTIEQMLEPVGLTNVEAWAKSTTVYIYNIFKVLADVPYRTRQMDQTIDQTRQSFHAVFELVFCTRRNPDEVDFQRARIAIATVLRSCDRLV